MSDPTTDRALAFARAALSRRLTTKEHAEECVKIARDAERRGKTLPIEEVFVRKGYLRRPEAQAILRNLDKEPALELAANVGATPEKARKGRRCPNCDKDPGHLPGECERCGTDLATGGPGPHATICTTCSRVVKRGSAVCPRCATPLGRDHHRKFVKVEKDGVGVWVDRAVLVLALGAGGYFLAFRSPPKAPPPETAASPEPLRAAEELAQKGDAVAAAKALEAVVQEPGHSPDADVAFALACRRAGRPVDARAALERARQARPEDAGLLVLEADVALDQKDADSAQAFLDKVPEARREDGWFRVRARLADARKDEDGGLAALQKIKQREPGESHRLAQAALAHARQTADAGKPEDAVRELEAAVALAPDYAPARERLGIVLLSLKRAALARQTFERAVDLAPREPGPHLGVALAAEAVGDRPAAIKEYRKFLELAAAAGGQERYGEEIEKVKKRLSVIAPD